VSGDQHPGRLRGIGAEELRRRDLERRAALNRIAKEAFECGLYDRIEIPEGGEDE
jgi:hypothetical protein